MNGGMSSEPRYDVCLSFAGENREYVEQVARHLRNRGVRVFYDAYEKAELWGKDLYVHLDEVYRNAARYCVLFASRPYADKLWTSHERRSAQARAFKENREYVLPARFDDTAIPGLPDTVGYIDLRTTEPDELAALIHEKLGPQPKDDFIPPVPDRLFSALGIDSEDESGAEAAEIASYQADRFVNTLTRMSPDEQRAVTSVLDLGCPAELPDNVHVDIDLVRRDTGFPPAKIKRLLGAVSSLGFDCSIRAEDHHHGNELGRPADMVVLEWDIRSAGPGGGNATVVAYEVVRLAQFGYCEMHGREALARRDFSQLASATTRPDEHQPHTDASAA